MCAVPRQVGIQEIVTRMKSSVTRMKSSVTRMKNSVTRMKSSAETERCVCLRGCSAVLH